MVDVSQQDYGEWLLEQPWNPRPLRRELRPLDYPIESLPPLIADAIREVQGYVQAPMAMTAACALSVVSVAVQHLFDVRRDSRLVGPASLYFLTLAESGERKTAIDRLFMEPLHDWQARQARAFREAKKGYDAQLEAWSAAGDELRQMQTQVDHTAALGFDLDQVKLHEAAKPQEPRLAQLLRGDDTTEALLIDLQQYPIAAVISSEAGVLFGSHSMGNETAMRNLATINVMWDGGPIRQTRVSRGRVEIERVRATYGLQVQPAVMNHFVERTAGLARGIGYFARFLFSHPESTQGTRYYNDPDGDMPALRAFCARVTALLDMPPLFDEFDRIDPQPVDMDADARKVWVAFHDEVEELLGCDSEYSGIRDVANKASENAVRLACCCHIFTMGSSEPITQKAMIDACSLMRWYLDEAVRFGQVADATEEVRNAELLEEWLTRRQNRGVRMTVNMVRQKGPNALRSGRKLDDAISLLADHDRIRVTQAPGSKTKLITIAPQVFKEYS
ncbi:YfjI family protein [Devosia sp.]|uniref:YfjI family protein n=1 Tax=Devosia sp. TaxID=1871048 RepID=UPI003A914BE9